MKIVTLLLAIFAFARAERHAFVVHSALALRGGSVEIGPLDGEMALKLAKTATMAYAAGGGSIECECPMVNWHLNSPLHIQHS